jgi:serine/threonine protein phosphatase Stp1
MHSALLHPLQCSAHSHPGTARRINDDAWLCRPEAGLFAVADGVGGTRGGHEAAARVTESLARIPSGLPARGRMEQVRAVLQDAHAELLAQAHGQSIRTAATTIVVLLLDRAHFACLWAGDSRAYLLRGGVLTPLTTDHSLVQDWLSAGRISAAEAINHPNGNVITRAVGAGDFGLAKSVGETRPGDRFLLCSDGLHKVLDDTALANLLEGQGDLAQYLVDAALQRRTTDNVTAVTVIR